METQSTYSVTEERANRHWKYWFWHFSVPNVHSSTPSKVSPSHLGMKNPNASCNFTDLSPYSLAVNFVIKKLLSIAIINIVMKKVVILEIGWCKYTCISGPRVPVPPLEGSNPSSLLSAQKRSCRSSAETTQHSNLCKLTISLDIWNWCSPSFWNDLCNKICYRICLLLSVSINSLWDYLQLRQPDNLSQIINTA